MQAPGSLTSPVGAQRHLVDLQYEEVANARTAILNRELVRLQGEGWQVRINGDHLFASRREAGRSQLERVLIAVGGFLALAYAATIFLADVVSELPISKAAFLGSAVMLGALVAFFTRDQAARDRQISVSVDGHGRPYVTELAKRDF